MNKMIWGLLRANFRHWGATQYRQYHSLLGRYGKVGIEIEALCPAPLGLWREATEGEQSHDVMLSWFNNTSSEIQILFDVTSPRALVKSAREKILELNKVGYPTLGGLHINYQIPEKAPAFTHNGVNFSTHWVTPELRRTELKFGVGFVHWQDLVLQMCCLSLLLQERAPKRFGEKVAALFEQRPYLDMPIDKASILKWMETYVY